MKLQEDRQPLYHITDKDGLYGILHTDKMFARPRLGEAVCFSRDPTYSYVFGTEKFFVARIVVDAEKLSHNYKIELFCSQSPYVKGRRFEAEERIYKTIKDIGKYIIDILPMENFSKFKYDKYFIDAYFKFLNKYPHIDNKLFPDLEDVTYISNEVSGIYKNGKKLQGFTEDTATEVVWNYFDLASTYEDEQEASYEHAHFTQGSPGGLSHEIFSNDLQGCDLIWTEYREIHIRAQDTSKYEWIKNLNIPAVEESYESPFENMLNPDYKGDNEDEDDEY